MPDLYFSHRRDDGVTGRQAGSWCRCSTPRVRENLERVRERIGPEVEICAAIKYVDGGRPARAGRGGIELVGENRAQELLAKQEAHGELFTWDFIGALQSRKVKDIAPNVRLIHSIASESALRKLEANPAREVLIQVNVAGEEAKEGVAPGELGDFIERCPVPGDRPDDHAARSPRTPSTAGRHFARLAELAAEHGLERLSMGTTQDYEVAAQEGATIVRLGTVLYDGG